jgi:hypothetical protein
VNARVALLLAVSSLAVSVAARAQAPSPATPAAPVSQLDRIEQKLDEVLRKLDQLHPQQPGIAQTTPEVPRGATLSPVPSAASTASMEAYKPGAIAIARAAPRDHNTLSAIPTDSVGGFVYTGGPIPFTDIRARGVRYVGPVGAEIQGWLRAREAGRYELATDLSAHFTTNANSPPTCLLHAWLEDSSLGERTVYVTNPRTNEADATLVLGAELQPGLYRLRVWTVCDAPPGVTTTSELLLKAPSELNLRPVTGADLLHREGT